jgi:hypothetical protein
MTRVIISALVLAPAAQLLIAQEKPPEEVFNRSFRNLVFHVPPDFQLVREDSGYNATHDIPTFNRIWKKGSDAGRSVSVVVLPEAAWQQHTNKQILDRYIAYMLSEPAPKLVSRRSYDLDGCPAESVTYFYEGSGGTSQRVDCFLAKPNVFVLVYLSSKPS